MAIQNFSPRFIKAQVVFQLGDIMYDMGEQLVNSSGVPGIKWERFDPLETVGKKVSVFMTVRCVNSFKISCPGTLTLESTENARFLGVTLILSPVDTQNLQKVIDKEGILPEYVRKFPRIPYMPKIGTMPFNVLLEYLFNNEKLTTVCHLDNISPSGFQVYTDDARSAVLVPKMATKVIFMPRGDAFLPVTLNAGIKRVTQSRDPISNNSRYYFGMSIDHITDVERSKYSVMLRKIVEQLKTVDDVRI